MSKFVLLGGKSYSLQREDKKKSDELIMESAKKLHGGLVLTDDKNLFVSIFLSSEFVGIRKNSIVAQFSFCIF